MNNFEKACEMSLIDWVSTLPDIVPEAEYTKKHEKWKKNLFNKMRGNYYHRFTTKTIKVMLVAAVLCALLLSAFVIPSSREYIIDNFEIFSTYKLTENNKNSVNGEIIVGYIPEGFELVNEQIFSKGIVNDYTDSSGKIITITKTSSSIKVDFDTEFETVENILIGERTYLYHMDDTNYGYLVWNMNDYIYQVHGSISKDELLKIAETVK